MGIQKQQELERQQAMQRHQEMQRQEDLSRQEEQRQQQYQQQLQQKQYQQQQKQEQQVQQFSQMAVESGTTVSEQRSFQHQQQQSQESFQSSSSFQQSSSVSKQQQEVFEATERDGAMRGYQPKGVDETGRRSAMARDSGLFGGIGGDDNSLVDNEFDYKKHSVKDLAHHFALVKPKAQLPNQILPGQQMFNGEQGPALNYLGGKQDFASQQQIFTKKEVSNEDIEASKAAYEMKKKQQMEQRQQTSSSSSMSSSQTQTSSSVVMREKKTEEVATEQVDRRRASISSALLMDPAAAHAEAGLIDPSAILRGSDGSSNRASIGLRASVPGETEVCASKWDNHNAIARGFTGMKDNYHPVTFRQIYNVDGQTNKAETTQNL